MLIEYTEPRIHVVRGGRVNGQQVEFEFRPGALNDVPEDVWEHLQEHSVGTQILVAEGKLRPLTIREARPAGLPQGGDGHASDKMTEDQKYEGTPKTAKDAKDAKGAKPKPVAKGTPEATSVPHTVASVKDLDITKMTDVDAPMLIAKVFDEGVLKKFQGQENKRRGGPRKKVMDALDKQLEVHKTDMTQGEQSLAEA